MPQPRPLAAASAAAQPDPPAANVTATTSDDESQGGTTTRFNFATGRYEEAVIPAELPDDPLSDAVADVLSPIRALELVDEEEQSALGTVADPGRHKRPGGEA